jgi:hypothetical protein
VGEVGLWWSDCLKLDERSNLLDGVDVDSYVAPEQESSAPRVRHISNERAGVPSVAFSSMFRLGCVTRMIVIGVAAMCCSPCQSSQQGNDEDPRSTHLQAIAVGTQGEPEDPHGEIERCRDCVLRCPGGSFGRVTHGVFRLIAGRLGWSRSRGRVVARRR